MNRKELFVVILLFIIVYSCKKETNEPPIHQGSASSDTLDCPPYELPNDSLGVLHSWSNYNKMMPYFNPNNNDEFLYIDKIPGSPFSDMCIHNLVTGETNCILSGQTYLYQPRWHANGWILFRGNGNNVFRIKSNGDSLLQITTSSLFQRPVWRPDGQAWISNNTSDFSGDIDVFDLQGNLIEVIQGEEFFKGDWSADNRIVTTKGYTGSNQLTWTHASEINWVDVTFDYNTPHLPSRDIHWIPMSDEVMISQLYEDISRINVFTGEKIPVTDRCIGTYYEYFSINNSCSKIVAQLISPEQIYSDGWFNIIIQKSEIVIMNFDGSGQQVINLP
jgi:hypothetical protein